MTAGGRVPADQAGPMHVHQGDEVLRVLSGQILIRCQIGSAPAEAELVKAYRTDAPAGRPPGQGQERASDEKMRGILDRWRTTSELDRLQCRQAISQRARAQAT
jgi:hypothetical protein